MAESKKILSSDLIQKDLFGNTIKSGELLLETLKKLELGFEQIIKVQGEILKNTKLDSAANIAKVTKAIDDNKVAVQGLEETKKKYTEAQAAAAAAAQLEKKDFADLVKLKKADIILQDKTRGALEKLNAANHVLRDARSRLISTDKDYADQVKKINKLIDINNAEILKNSDQLKKQKMNVGNYTSSIKSALGQTGLFNNTLLQSVEQLKNLVKGLKASSEGASKLSTAFKAITAVGLVGAIVAITAAIKGNLEFVKFSERMWSKLLDTLSGGMTNYEAATIAQQKLTESLRKQRLELQQLVLDEQDQIEISNDTTISYANRDEALQKSFDLREKIAKKNVEIAQEEFDAAEAQVIAGAVIGNVTDDQLNKRTDAQLKLNEAKDAVDDLDRQRSERQRKRTEDELIRDLELLRSKKKASTAAIDLLENEITEQKNQIEEREKSLQKFNETNRKTFDQQIKLIKDRLGIEFNADDLLAERDNVLLAEKLKKLETEKNLGEAVVGKLAEVIKKAQDAEIKGLQFAGDLEEDKIKRLQTIQQIQEEIDKARRDDLLSDLQIQENIKKQQSDRLSTQLSTKPFRKSELDTLKESLSSEEVLQQQISEAKFKNLDKQRIADLAKTETEIDDLQIRAERKKQIEEQYLIDVQNLTDEYSQQRIDQQQRTDDILESLQKQKNAEIINALTNVTSALQTELDKRSQLEQDAFDRDLEQRSEAIQRQQELASQGFENQLAFEQAQQAKTELARKDAIAKAQKQKEQAQMVEAYFNAYNSRMSKDGASPAAASAQAFTDVLLAKGLSKTLVQFAMEGTDNVQPVAGSGGGDPNKDDIPFLLNKEEAVIKAKSNKKYKGVAKALNDGSFEKMYIPKASLKNAVNKINGSAEETVGAASFFHQDNRKIIDLLNKISEKPSQHIDVDKLGNIVETIVTGKMKTTTIHKSNRI